ncbi:exodeoxyribonuclease III [Allohahella marinimesophila]|uniref:Exodeoxyribonuclease III n=1 Tax=Allohahella marinimesophila TaxID=1054972 RepID=A0ABP7P4E5_9GAMM
MRLISWNVNGIRAVMKKNFEQQLVDMAPDILCLQETKAQDEQVVEALSTIEGFHIYTNSAEKKGYSGTAILTRTKPLAVEYDMGIEEHDNEGRVIAAEYEDFILITVYTPNSGSELKRLGYRTSWDADFLAYIRQLETRKPILVCGDLNVAHQPIDLARPQANYNKAAGYMQEEIDGFVNLMGAGLKDTFRELYPDTVKYTWWSYRAGARARNVGWRIDYFLSSPSLLPRVSEAFIYNEIDGSDHCPVGVELTA